VPLGIFSNKIGSWTLLSLLLIINILYIVIVIVKIVTGSEREQSSRGKIETAANAACQENLL
jgi:hypothetical protein